MTTATLSRRIIRPMSTRPARRSMLIGFGATLAIGILLLATASAAVGVASGSNVLGGVSVAGVELAGLDRAAAASRLSDELPALDTGTAVLAVGETEIEVPYADLGRGYETEAMVDAAYGVGRSGNPIADGIGRLRSLLHATALPVIVHAYDDDALAGIAADVATDVSQPPREARGPAGRHHVHRPRERRGARPRRVECRCRPRCRSRQRGSGGHPGGAVATTLLPVVDTASAERAAATATAMAADLEVTIPGADDEEPLVIGAESIAAARLLRTAGRRRVRGTHRPTGRRGGRQGSRQPM